MKDLYPPIDPFNSFLMKTGSRHSIYVEQCGNPLGTPVVFLHGGPCSGCKPDHRRFFNPKLYHVILLDQRGCGRSLPFGELTDNTTPELVEDLEKIRQQLGLGPWLLFGGSWGAALALLYAQRYPRNVSGMIIRGVFLAREKDLTWFLQDGAARIYPESWQSLYDCLHGKTLHEMLESINHIISSADEIAVRRLTKAWMVWGAQTALAGAYQPNDQPEHITQKMVEQVRMELHYAYHRYFVSENQLIDHCDRLTNIATIVIHGRNDLVCPLEAGYSLAKALPQAEFIVLPDSGHVAQGAEMIDALVTATDRMILKL